MAEDNRVDTGTGEVVAAGGRSNGPAEPPRLSMAAEPPQPPEPPKPVRRKLPDDRQAITHKFDIAGYEGYITVGLFEDGRPGEIFLVMARDGSTISGFADSFAQAISYSLQYGVPLQDLVDKFSHVYFEPAGMTRNPEIRFAKSIVDYVFRWLALKFLTAEGRMEAERLAHKAAHKAVEPVREPASDAPACSTCGSIMVRSGIAWKCNNCGNTTGSTMDRTGMG